MRASRPIADPGLPAERPGYSGSVVVLMVATAAATASGFFRELVIANFFGASIASDAISVVVYLYDIISTLFYQSALAYAVVPLMAGYRVREEVDAERDLVMGVGLWLAAGGLVIGAGLVAFGDVAARVLFSARGPESLAALSTGLRIGAVGLVCACLASFLAGVLQAQNRYNAFPLGRMAWNAVTIGMALVVPGPARFVAILAGLSLGGVAQLGVTLRAIPRRLLGWRRGALTSPPVRHLARASLPALLGLGAAGMGLGLGERALLALLAPGSVAIASFAQRTSTLASTVGLAFLTVSFAEMALEHGRENRDKIVDTLLRTVREATFVLAPVAGVFFVLSQQIVSLLFGHGAFSATAVVVTSGALRLYALSLIPGFLTGILARGLFAVSRPWSAVVATASATVVALTCDVTLLRPLGVYAIPVGYATGCAASTVVAVVLLRKMLGVRIGVPLLRSLVAAPLAAASAVVVLVLPVRAWHVTGPGVAGKTADLVTAIVGGLAYFAVYVALSGAFRLPELQAVGRWLAAQRHS